MLQVQVLPGILGEFSMTDEEIDRSYYTADDAISEYIWKNPRYENCNLSINPLPHNIWIALADPKGCRKEYAGWFLVIEEEKGPSSNWVFRGKYGKWNLYQSKNDDEPERSILN